MPYTLTWTNPLTYLTNRGLTLTLVNQQLRVKPASLVTKDISDYIAQHKDTLIEHLKTPYQDVRKLPQFKELNPQQQKWLTNIADILQVTTEYLLQHQLIDQYDLVELIDKNPMLVAKTIKTGCYWIKLKNY